MTILFALGPRFALILDDLLISYSVFLAFYLACNLSNDEGFNRGNCCERFFYVNAFSLNNGIPKRPDRTSNKCNSLSFLEIVSSIISGSKNFTLFY